MLDNAAGLVIAREWIVKQNKNNIFILALFFLNVKMKGNLYQVEKNKNLTLGSIQL